MNFVEATLVAKNTSIKTISVHAPNLVKLFQTAAELLRFEVARRHLGFQRKSFWTVYTSGSSLSVWMEVGLSISVVRRDIAKKTEVHVSCHFMQIIYKTV